jgi:uncharacterized protein YifE (UPF0438 family)
MLPEPTSEESELLSRWLWFHDELALGKREPTNSRQEHFVAVTRGRAVAENEHERA